MEKIAKNIEAIREEKGLKQSEMAEKLKISQAGYSNIIHRGKSLTLSKLSQICDIMGVSVIDVLTYPEKYIPESSVPKVCTKCVEKDKIISNLNNYIETLHKNHLES